jgi:CheY-like chemotaxis protein
MNDGETSLQVSGQEGRPLILIVDDHPAQRKLFKLLVDNLAITADIVASCEEAVQALASRRYDLILMDWQMPEVDGLACTAMIREKERAGTARTPIVAVTAHVLPGDREACLRAGMDDYLGKPFTVKELRGMIDRWTKQNLSNSLVEEAGRVS